MCALPGASGQPIVMDWLLAYSERSAMLDDNNSLAPTISAFQLYALGDDLHVPIGNKRMFHVEHDPRSGKSYVR